MLSNKTGGKVKCCQSVDPPYRTIMALVKAANVIVIAAKPTQIPVRDAGEVSSTDRARNVSGGKSCHPPCPGGVRESILGGSWTVVAILLLYLLRFSYAL